MSLPSLQSSEVMFGKRALHKYVHIHICTYVKSSFPKHDLWIWHWHCQPIFWNGAYCVLEKSSSYTYTSIIFKFDTAIRFGINTECALCYSGFRCCSIQHAFLTASLNFTSTHAHHVRRSGKLWSLGTLPLNFKFLPVRQIYAWPGQSNKCQTQFHHIAFVLVLLSNRPCQIS